jgi:hypothetical protein
MNFWDDGDIDSFVVGDKDADLASRFAITGSATIAPGWSGGFNLTVVAPGGVFDQGGTFGIISNQEDELPAFVNDTIRTLYSYIYIKSDTLGTLNWGYLSPASDNPAVLADISGTVIESNAVFFEGGGFFLRPKGSGASGFAGLHQDFQWINFLGCYTGGGVGADCFGAPRPAVRYDSPTWGGFRFETSYGTVDGLDSVTPESNFWDAAVFYTADWNSIKLSAAAAYTWTESNAIGFDCSGVESLDGGFKVDDCGEADLFQIGASIMHKPSGLGIYGLYQHEEVDGRFALEDVPSTIFVSGFRSLPDTDVWYVKPFWRKAWSPIGATVLYGEYGEYQDQFGSVAQVNLFNDNFFGTVPGCIINDCFITGSEVQRWGLGVVQEIDSAAMHLWVRWQHQELDVDVTSFGPGVLGDPNCPNGCKVGVFSSDDWDLFQVGGIIFF